MPTGPYSQDLLTRIYNVQWGGLAVEFTKEPSYLTLNHALSMNKVVISFWFRVPSESAAEVKAATEAFFWDYRVFHGVIPLIAWGSQQTTVVSETTIIDTGAIDSSADIITIEEISGSHTAPLQPSAIGVRVENDPPLLDVHIQTNVHASGTGLAKIASSWTGQYAGTEIHTGKPIYANVKYLMTDVSYTVTEEPEYLGNSDANTSGSGAGHPEVEVDEWHHLLISWELVSHTNMGGACKMWCAIDDKNKAGSDLPAMNDPTKMEPNEHVSSTINACLGNAEKSASVTFGADDVPSNPFQPPGPPTAQRASDEHGGVVSIAPIAKVELAELQIFTGITLDTGVEKNRRAFIDYKRDGAGNIIRDTNGKATLEPVNPDKAEKLLGKKPEIMLHGSSRWIKGGNTGSTGFDYSVDPPVIKPEGQFKPTGKIKEYRPDPEIVVA